MIKGGYIIQARKIKDSEVAKMAPCTREVWGYILREAFFADTKNLKRGQLFTKIDHIREDLSWHVGYRKLMYTRRQCEGAFESLRKVGMIVTTKVAQGIIITVCKYDYYQNIKNYEWGTESGNEDSANVTRRLDEGGTIYNKEEERIIKKNKNTEREADAASAATPVIDLVAAREEKFKKSLVPFVEGYGKEMIRAFFDYWREPNKSKTRMRWEMEKTWDLELRLKKWQSNQDKFEKGKSSVPTITQPKPIPGVTQSTGSAPLPISNGRR